MKKFMTKLLIFTVFLGISACSVKQDFNSTKKESKLTKSSVSENGCTRPYITDDEDKYHRAQFGAAFKSTITTYEKEFTPITVSHDYPNEFSGWGGANEAPSTCTVNKIPVIFIHGNGDSAQDWAFDGPGYATGAPRNDFIAAGYNANELFALSVNNPTMMSASLNYHDSSQIEKIANFIEAVKAYTGKNKVSIVTHSLGVTMTRRAIQDYNLENSVDVHVAIAGANGGLFSCGTYPFNVPSQTCGLFYFYGMPVYVDGLAMLSPHLLDMVGKKLANKLYTIWGANDSITLGYVTSHIGVAESNVQAYTSGHFGLMHSTGALQVYMVSGGYPAGIIFDEAFDNGFDHWETSQLNDKTMWKHYSAGGDWYMATKPYRTRIKSVLYWNSFSPKFNLKGFSKVTLKLTHKYRPKKNSSDPEGYDYARVYALPESMSVGSKVKDFTLDTNGKITTEIDLTRFIGEENFRLKFSMKKGSKEGEITHQGWTIYKVEVIGEK